MNNLHLELEWMDADQSVDLVELSRICEMSAAELKELVEYGALSPVDSNQQDLQFPAPCIAPLRTASKLRRDYDLDLFTIVLLMDYLHRIETLETELRSIQARHS